MVTTRKADQSIFYEVYPLLKEYSPSFSESIWYSIFDYQWQKDENYCGYALFDDEEVVGFLGLLFCKRVISGKNENFCNLTTWVVKEQYRSHSLSLMRPILQLKDHTITDFSPSDGVARISKRLGFKELDSSLKMLLPIERYRNKNSIQIFHASNEIQAREILSTQDLQLFQDHQGYPFCRHLITYGNSGYCYIVYTMKRSKKMDYCYIHYISNISLFSQYSIAIRSAIAKAHKISLILVDSRLVKQIKLPFTYRLPIRFIKLYKSTSLDPEQIDNLYSELTLLNFNVLPKSLGGLWRSVLKNFQVRFLQGNS